jgi:hypothetical protein
MTIPTGGFLPELRGDWCFLRGLDCSRLAIKAVASDEWLVARKDQAFADAEADESSFSAKHLVRCGE